jgi:hypothetical protein
VRKIHTNITMCGLTCTHCEAEIEYRDKFIETESGHFCSELCEEEAGGDPLAETEELDHRC